MENNGNIFEKGCLIQLSISMWRATKKLDKNVLAKMSTNYQWLSATKKLIDPEALKPVEKAGNAARTYLSMVSLPFPIHGMTFAPKDLITQIDKDLEDYRNGFINTVNDFLDQYNDLRGYAESYLGDLFSQFDYPLDVKERFSFVWRFINLDVPNGRFGVLSPELYEKEKSKFIETMEEAREMAINALREEFGNLVQHLCERLSSEPGGKPKVFKNSTITNFYEYFQTFKERNIFADEDLASLVVKAQEALKKPILKQ